MILARRVASALTGVGISRDDSELRDAGVQPKAIMLPAETRPRRAATAYRYLTYTGQCARLEGWRYPSEGCILFSFDIERNRKVKGPAPDQPGIKIHCLALTPAMILFIALPSSEEKTDPG